MPTRTREVVVRNRARCELCGDEIESIGRHDFIRCNCGSLAVDGGREYLRRVGNLAPGTWTELSETYEEQYESDW
jgi:tRNA(Ile2) C34 agmatinyltransferase TiaS